MSAGYTERPYQLEAMARTRDLIRQGHKRIVIVAPTGSGKTVTAAGIVRRAVAKGRRVYFLAHRRELIDQCSGKLDESDVDHGVIMASHWRRYPKLPVQVASVQTLIRRMHHLERAPDIIIIDECHRSNANTYRKIIEACPQAIVLGLTATPVRADGKGLDETYERMVQTITVSELTTQGHLVPVRYLAPTRPDVSGVHTRRGDYDPVELAAAMDKVDLVGDVIKTWRERAADRLTVVFEINVARSKRMRDAFRANGVTAEHVDGRTPDKERSDILERWKRGDIQVVTNCEVLTEGFDMPAMSAVVLCRRTKHEGLFLQMVGRGLRPWPGKADCLILDHAGACWDCGFPSEDRDWSLEGRATRGKRDVKPRVTTCPNCFAAFNPTTTRTCPECGWTVPVSEREVKHIEGKLEEINLSLVKRNRKRQEGMAETYEDLLRLGIERGYENPHAWARIKMKYREARRGRAA